MRIILVTSELTYAPKNYNDVLEFVLSNSQQHVPGVIVIKINLLNIFGKIIYLYFSGCKNMASALARNMSDVLLGRKKKFIKKYNIPFMRTGSINSPEAISWIRKINPDLILNMRTRCIYKDAVLKIPRLGCVNVHHGILPQQKGLFCDLYALADSREAGFTIHEMTNKIDQGKVFYQERIERTKNYMDYLGKVSLKEGTAISNFINEMARNNFLPEGTLDKCDTSIVTTTPDFNTIKQLQSNGIIL